MIYDCIIIGGGVIGCATLDRLSRYNLSCLLLEKSDDVASFASKANSGIVHAGYDCDPGTLKAKFNVEGNPLVFEDAKNLDVPCLKCGSIVVAKKDQLDKLNKLKEKADKNNVDAVILSREETLKIEPNIADDIEYSLYAKEAGIVSPFQLTIGYADRSILNGAEIQLNQEVIEIVKDDIFIVKTKDNKYKGKIVINCAGEYSPKINDLVQAEHYEATYRRGDYFLLDNTERKRVNKVIFQLPTELGKGILVSPTADGNVIYGPTAIDTVLDDTTSTLDSLNSIKEQVPLSYKNPAYNKCIRIYSGLRTIVGHDFVIEKSKVVDNYIYAVGICSPGLSSAPAIARYIEKLFLEIMPSTKKDNIVIELEKKKRLIDLSDDELNDLIKKDSRWGRIVCRCEKVCEMEIINAIHQPLMATTVDAIKRRTRAGMGRCQGGFCAPRVLEIISNELKIHIDEVKKGNGEDSNIAVYHVKKVK